MLVEAFVAQPPVEALDVGILDGPLLEAYPFGERKYWPYKSWLQAIKRWLTLRQ